MKKKVSIIILTHKSDRDTIECVKTLRNFGRYEYIVVDNGGSSTLKQSLRKISRLIRYVKTSNRGYGAGNNLGIKSSHGEYLLILNPDVVIKKSDVEKLVKYLDTHTKTDAVGPNLHHANGDIHEFIGTKELNPLSAVFSLGLINKIFPNNKISRSYWLKDVPKDKVREVASIPGSCFMIRRSVFEKIGGFDEKMFMYFEEHDLGKRIIEAGSRLAIIPGAKAIHKWKDNGVKTKKAKLDFLHSRHYYFKKHFGPFKAALTEMLLRISKYDLAFIAVFAIGVFLRFYRLEENFFLHGELGYNYVKIKDFIVNRQIPLVGPPTSHPWLSFGPLYYWMMIPIFLIFNFDPLIPSYFMALLSSLVILMNYIFVSKWVLKSSAILTSAVVATSFPFIQISRNSMFFSLVVVVFYPFLHVFIRSLNNKKYIFWTFLFLGIMLNFHLTPVILLPTMILVYLFLGRFKQIYFWKNAILGLSIPTIPLIISDAKNSFSMSVNFLLWIPYRIAGFFGFLPKNNADSDVLISNIASFYKFISDIFVVRSSFLSWIYLLTIVAGIFYLRKKKVTGNKKKFALVVYLFLILGYVAIFLHGDPPSHYFLPLYPLPILILGLIYACVSKYTKALILALFLIGSFFNFQYYFSSEWFLLPVYNIKNSHVPYKLQKATTSSILKDSKGLPYILRRIGHGDHFEGEFAQNYQYLLWLGGNEPIFLGEDVVLRSGVRAIATYTIAEEKVGAIGEKIFEQGGISVYRSYTSQRI